jgi:hypothetical protein
MSTFIKVSRNGVDITHLTPQFAQRAKGKLPSSLGDKIASIAQPIARVIDKLAGTKIAGCGGCKKMKERLNAGTPLGEAIKKRIKGQ